MKLDLLATTPSWTETRYPTLTTANLSLNDTDGVDASSNALSRHTYCTGIYDYDDDELIYAGGQALAGATGVGTSTVSRVEYSVDETAWTNTGIANVPTGDGGSAHHGHYLEDGYFVAIKSGSGQLHLYDKTASSWSTKSTEYGGSNPAGCSLYDSKRGRVIIFGYHASNVLVINPWIGGGATQATTSVPGGLTLSSDQCGGVYDSYLDKYVFWDGGTAIYELDPYTWAWSTPTLDTQTVTPSNPPANGTFNRFQYIEPRSGVFPEGGYIICNGTDESTYFYYVEPASGGASPRNILLLGVG
jgi:hypothetical protein